ncbi:HigA family addiction module antidote protein [Alcaligenaceae bacterium]|nr:HigA family addiction module antidote protein [Alcaligenaceae bacterium]
MIVSSDSVHPGHLLRNILPLLDVSITEAAAQLNVTRAALSRVLNGRAAISIEMALRLEGWIGTERGSKAEIWLAQQAAHDLWKARTAGAPQVQRAEVSRSLVQRKATKR